MAAARRWSKEIRDITECPICVETFTDPKVLPCVHTFCLKCLLKYGEHDKLGDQMACPLCRANFVIPPGGLADLPNNFFVNKLLLANQLTDASKTLHEKPCDICKEDDADENAIATTLMKTLSPAEWLPSSPRSPHCHSLVAAACLGSAARSSSPSRCHRRVACETPPPTS